MYLPHSFHGRPFIAIAIAADGDRGQSVYQNNLFRLAVSTTATAAKF